MISSDDLYLIQMAVTGDVKVGRTNNVARRLPELQTGSPHPLRVLLVAKGVGYRELEIHRALRAFRIRRNGEWFREEGIGSIPDDIWELVSPEVLDDPDWWRRPTGKTFPIPAPVVAVVRRIRIFEPTSLSVEGEDPPEALDSRTRDG